MNPERMLRSARRRLPESLALLEALVRTNSHATNGAGLARCRTLLRAPLERLGFEVFEETRRAPDPRDPRVTLERTHLLAERRACRPALPRVLLLGHLDTVFPEGHAFPLDRRADRWVGPGVSDMKGGLVTALLSLELLAEAKRLDEAAWRVCFVADEEQGSPTAGSLLATARERVDVAVCFEAARPGGELVAARKGLGVATVRASGPSGHSGIAHDKVPNALTALARFLVAAEALEGRFLGLSVSPGGPVRVHPEAVNLIPAEASCELEWRFGEHAQGDAIASALAALAGDIQARSGAIMEFRVFERTPPMRASDATLIEGYVHAGAALGLRTGAVETAGVGDINVVAGGGAACIDGAGPEGAGFHTDEEHLWIASVAERAAMNALAMSGWLSGRR